jgi:hypothetical protein
VINDPRYADINNVTFPPCSRNEADRAAQMILSRLGRVGSGSENQILAAKRDRPPRRCWISPKPTTGHFKGWGRLIHDISHAIHRARHPKLRPHDPTHVLVEREVLLLCIEKGFLDGKLADKPKPKPSRKEVLLLRGISMEKRLILWTRKKNRAENAIAKLLKASRANDRELKKLDAA